MNQPPEEGTFQKITAFPKSFTNGLCYGPTFGHINYVVPAIWPFWSCCSNRVFLCCWMVTLMVSHQPAATGSSSEDHGCSWGHRQGEHLAHSLSDGNLMSFSSTSVWDVKDALIIEAGRKISSGTLLCWKTLILQNWNTSQEHVDSIEGFDGKQTGRLSGKPELLVLCQPGLPWLPSPQVASSPAFWHPYQVSTLEVGQPGGVGGVVKHEMGGGTGPQIDSSAVAFFGGFLSCTKIWIIQDKITNTSFYQREILFSRLIYQRGDTAGFCFVFAYTSHIYSYDLRWIVFDMFTLK